MEPAHGFDDDADDLAGDYIQPTLGDQVIVHHRIEIGVIGGVVDVTVGIVIGPAGRQIDHMRIAVPARAARHVVGHNRLRKSKGPPCYGAAPFLCLNLLNSPYFCIRQIRLYPSPRGTVKGVFR